MFMFEDREEILLGFYLICHLHCESMGNDADYIFLQICNAQSYNICLAKLGSVFFGVIELFNSIVSIVTMLKIWALNRFYYKWADI